MADPIDLLGEAVENLRKPAFSLPLYGKVLDQKTGTLQPFDPYAITYRMQADILAYMSDTPRTPDGQFTWMNVLKARQTGGSTTPEAGGVPLTMYSPGMDFLCIADTDDRAKYLHGRAQVTYGKWPEEIRIPQVRSGESLQLTFDHGDVTSRMRVMSGRSAAAGIGQSPDFLHGSELAFWKDAAGQWTLLQPALINRWNARVLFECTPAPLSSPSAPWWKDHFFDGKRGRGRFRSRFYPFWDGKLNARPWPRDTQPDLEEQRLLERYASQGLTLDNLWFRRFTMENDREIRKNPALFDVFYPFNYVDCWLEQANSLIPAAALARHVGADLIPSDDGEYYHEFHEPDPNAVYVIGVDPAGLGRDHSSFQVLEVWDDEWVQVAEYGGSVDSIVFGDALLHAAERYNNAMVAIERNGVGLAAVDYMRAKGYRNLYWDKFGKPGVWKHSHDQMMGALITALLDFLTLRGTDTVRQLSSYGGDAMVERPVESQVLYGIGPGRRERHHWDKVSALAVACIAAKRAPARYKSRRDETEPETSDSMTMDKWEAYIKAAAPQKPVRRRPHKWRR